MPEVNQAEANGNVAKQKANEFEDEIDIIHTLMQGVYFYDTIERFHAIRA